MLMSDFDVLCLVVVFFYQVCKRQKLVCLVSKFKKVSFTNIANVVFMIKNFEGCCEGDWNDLKLRRRCFYVIVTSVVLSYTFMASLYTIMKFSLNFPCKYSFVEFFWSMNLTQFVLVSSMFRTRFKALNERIVHLNFIHSAKDPNIVAQLHRQLFDGIDILNQTFTFQLLPIFASLTKLDIM